MTKQQPLLGFLFALTTAMAWGSLPLALKQVVAIMDAKTIVWYRFVVATISLFILLICTNNLPKFRQFNRNYVIWTIVGVLGLAANFFLFSTSLNYIEPSIAQIFIHLSSFGMLVLGVFLFKEKLGLHQKLGLIILIIGLALFFNDRFVLFFSLNASIIGILLSVGGALIWVAYGLAQKVMLRSFTSQQILLLMYFGCAIVFTPSVELSQVFALTPFAWGCFIYCCLNTMIGYGAYAEALNRWDVSKVSVVLTLVPLFTILFSHIAHAIDPKDFANPQLNTVSYIGAFVVVLGASLSAIGHKLFKGKK